MSPSTCRLLLVLATHLLTFACGGSPQAPTSGENAAPPSSAPSEQAAPAGATSSGGATPCTGDCTSTGSCQDVCEAGTERCTEAGQAEACVKLSSGCLGWQPSTGHTCAPSTGACTEGQRRCGTGGSLETCDSKGAWVGTSHCPQACTDGTCTAAVTCSPGAVRCNGLGVETCNSSGTAWLHVETCSVACTSGLCTGACTAGQRRCNGSTPEECNEEGSGWTPSASCQTACLQGECLEADLIVDGVTVTMEGTHHVQNSVVVKNGGRIQVGPSGALQLHAKTVTVDAASSLSAEGVGKGKGAASDRASLTDLSTSKGDSSYSPAGGILDIRARSIQVDGVISSDGNKPYGGGGTVLLAANELNGTGMVRAFSHYGGKGLLKLLHGAKNGLNVQEDAQTTVFSIMPPLTVVSSSHPDPTRTYNDELGTVSLAWERPFPSLNGYYFLLSSNPNATVTPASATYTQAESVTLPLAASGESHFQIVSVDSAARIGTVKNVHRIRINSIPPSVSSSSHPSEGTWYTNNAAYLSWTDALDARDVNGYYYVLDTYADTVPSAANGIFTPHPQLLLSNLEEGAWVFHVVARDSQNRITKAAEHFKLFIGTEPVRGNLTGSTVDAKTKSPLSGVTLRINGGLFEAVSTASGTFTFDGTVYEGEWELTASKPGYATQTRRVKIEGAQVSNESFSLEPTN